MKKRHIVSLSCMLMTTAVSIGLAQSVPSSSTTRNEVGFVIGATETPRIGLQGGGNVNLNPSLDFGAEYDRLLT